MRKKQRDQQKYKHRVDKEVISLAEQRKPNCNSATEE